MPSVHSLFPSKYLAAVDLENNDRVFKIKSITAAEEVGQNKDKRPVLYFNDAPKGMVLNKTNAKRITKLYGEDTDNWIGELITVYPSECDFGDETVPCVRVRPDKPKVDGHASESIQVGQLEKLSDEELETLMALRKARKTASAP